MITLAQRIEELRTARSLSRPALAAALGLPRMAVKKFETGRQTPTQEQQEQLAAYFGVSVFYLRGENNDPTRMDDWMDGAFQDAPQPQQPQAVSPARAAKKSAAAADSDSGTVFDAFLNSRKFQEALRAAVQDALRSPEGQEQLARAVRRELGKH